MRRKPFQEILHPPELHGKEKRQYWLAVGGWFACVFGLMILSGMLLMAVAYGMERIFDEKFLQAYGLWFLGVGLGGMLASFILGHCLWTRLFVKSGYLSDASVIRIMSNRAPTKTSERNHRSIAYSIPVLIGGFFAWIAWREQAYWGVLGSVAFGGWLLFSVWSGWKQSDADKQSGQISSPEVEKCARNIQKVLDERSGKPDNPDEGSHLGQ